MRLPEGWRQKVNNDGWFHGDAQAFLNPGDAMVFAAIYAPDRSTTAEAEADLERMVWALEGGDQQQPATPSTGPREVGDRDSGAARG